MDNENELKLKQVFIKYYFLPERLIVPEVESKLKLIVNNSQTLSLFILNLDVYH